MRRKLGKMLTGALMQLYEIQLSQLGEVGATLEVAAGISDLWGDFSSVSSITDVAKLFCRVSNVLMYVTESKKKKNNSALQRVRDLSDHHFVQSLV